MNFLQHLLESALGTGQAVKSAAPVIQEHRMLPNNAQPMQHMTPRLPETMQAKMPIWQSPNLDTGGQEMQGGQFNPGYVPLQSPRGYSAHPQIQAYGGVQRPGDQVNPQSTGFSWNNY